MVTVAGLDGWKGGWVGVALAGGAFAGAWTTATITEALAGASGAAAVGIDIPIGLPASGTRAADVAAKRRLGTRASTVFLTPPRAVLEAPSYAAARRISIERSGRSVSAQAYALRARILEVEAAAAADPRMHEVHPELAFLAMNGGRVVSAGKKTWAGQNLRRRLLASHGVRIPDDLGDAGVVPPDDVLDAAACAWSAARIAAGRAEWLPDEADPDGNTPLIWY